MASNNCTNTFRSLICIVNIGNIHKGTCRIIIFPRFIWAYKAGAIISDVAMHFEPCYGLIRPYIFLFNSLMPSVMARCTRTKSKSRLRPRGVLHLQVLVCLATNVVTTAEKRPAFDILHNEAKQRQLQTHKDK